MCSKVNYYNPKKKIALVVRTMDFASPTGMQEALFNANETYSNPMDGTEAKTKFKFLGKYSDIGFTVLGKHYGARAVSDGVNDQGLALATLWNAGTRFDTSVKQPADCFSGLTLPIQILGSCATVNDVLKMFEADKVDYYTMSGEAATKYVSKKRVNIPTKELQGFATIHLGLFDKTGNQMVVEFENVNGKDGVAVFYPDPYGVLTNAPHITWQHENLRNYVGLTDKFNVTEGDFMGVKVPTTGFGNNLRSLPADNTPSSRFVRLVVNKNLMLKNGEFDTVDTAMAALDTLIGSVVLAEGTSANHGTIKADVDSTLWISMYDCVNFKMYKKTPSSFNWQEMQCKTVKLEMSPSELQSCYSELAA